MSYTVEVKTACVNNHVGCDIAGYETHKHSHTRVDLQMNRVVGNSTAERCALACSQ